MFYSFFSSDFQRKPFQGRMGGPEQGRRPPADQVVRSRSSLSSKIRFRKRRLRAEQRRPQILSSLRLANQKVWPKRFALAVRLLTRRPQIKFILNRIYFSSFVFFDGLTIFKLCLL